MFHRKGDLDHGIIVYVILYQKIKSYLGNKSTVAAMINRLIDKKSKSDGSMFSNVKICCFPLSYLIVNSIL